MIETLEVRWLANATVRHKRPVHYVDAGTLNVSGSVNDDTRLLRRS